MTSSWHARMLSRSLIDGSPHSTTSVCSRWSRNRAPDSSLTSTRCTSGQIPGIHWTSALTTSGSNTTTGPSRKGCVAGWMRQWPAPARWPFDLSLFRMERLRSRSESMRIASWALASTFTWTFCLRSMTVSIWCDCGLGQHYIVGIGLQWLFFPVLNKQLQYCLFGLRLLRLKFYGLRKIWEAYCDIKRVLNILRRL